MQSNRGCSKRRMVLWLLWMLVSGLAGLPLSPLLAQHEGHQMPGSMGPGDSTADGSMPGHSAPGAILSWLPVVLGVAALVFVVWLTVQVRRGRKPVWLTRQVVWGTVIMLIAYALTSYVVAKFKKPGQMTVIEAQAMDMTVMKAPVGSVPVLTEKAARGTFNAKVSYTGTVVAYIDEDIYPRVTGWVREMLVYPGDKVRAGQLVARLDSSELGSRVNEADYARLTAEEMSAQMAAEETQARASRAEAENEVSVAQSALRGAQNEQEAALEASRQAEADVDTAQSELAAMEADLTAAQANLQRWQEQVKRTEVLYSKGAVSLEELQKDQADARSAQAAVTAAEAKVRQSRAGVQNAEAAVRQAAAMARAAQARVEQARAMLGKSLVAARGAAAGVDAAARKRRSASAASAQMRAALATASVIKGYTEIRSIGGGVVTHRLVSPGVLVNPGTPILKIAQIDRVRLQANVAEQDVAGIRIGNTVRVHTMKDPTRITQTRVTSIFPAADPASRTVVVEAMTPNPDHHFVSGEYVVMEIETHRIDNAVTVANTALLEVAPEQTGIFYTRKQHAVWVVRTRESTGKTEYYCTMHPEVISDKPGDCPKCLMKLEPRTKGGNKFAHRVPVTIGSSDGKRTVILSGLSGDEEIIIAGNRNLRENDAVQPQAGVPDAGAVQEDAAATEVPAAAEAAGHKGHVAVTRAPSSPASDKASYSCPMHPEVRSDKPGQCPKCGMRLEKMASGSPGQGAAAGGAYACPMHPEVVSDKPDRCPKCGMMLEKK